jgi:hypothetical protein
MSQWWPMGTADIAVGQMGSDVPTQSLLVAAVSSQRPPLHVATVSHTTTLAPPYSQTIPCGPHASPDVGAAVGQPIVAAPSDPASTGDEASDVAVCPGLDDEELHADASARDDTKAEATKDKKERMRGL